jgi:aspartyl aminopeptidase
MDEIEQPIGVVAEVSPEKKKRGRPKKSDSDTPQEVRKLGKRGRPKKASAKAKPKTKKGRGRPKKTPLDIVATEKKGRGRPKKNPLEVTSTVKRGRGRPKKEAIGVIATEKKGRGRPKKGTEITDKNDKSLTAKLCYKTKNIWDVTDDIGIIMDFAKPYKKFLNSCKTEREGVNFAITELKKAGFTDNVKDNKVFMVNRGKGIIAAIKGKKPLLDGFNLVIAHLDAPRIDLKQVPFYEDMGHAMLDTHYYGGIKKYQWTNIPLALHGTIILRDGTRKDIVWGEKEDEGAVVITDILIHLAQTQLEAPAAKALTGEQMNAIAGSMPIKGKEYEKEADKVKLNILRILNKKFGITEHDFISAEIELVPAENCREIGIDNSMLMGYGHDDRICSYTALKAMLDMKSQPERTAIVYLVDKEEIGSEGTTGAITKFLEHFIEKLHGGFVPNEVMQNSFCLSADVNAGFDVNFKDKFEAKNAAFIGKGVTMTKFTGRGGKGGASDASAEFVGAVRKLWNDHSVIFQTAELGAVDIGGGGTVAMYLAARGIDTVDAGPAVLGMHAPKETISKADLYSSYLAYKAFLEKFDSTYVKIAKNTY